MSKMFLSLFTFCANFLTLSLLIIGRLIDINPEQQR